jgi:hypothetical protein
MAGAIVPHETDVNLTNLHFPSAAEPQPKREKKPVLDVIFTTETQSPHGSASSPRAEFFVARILGLVEGRALRASALKTVADRPQADPRGEFFSGSIESG